MSSKSTCRSAAVLVFVAEYSDCSLYRCFTTFTILKSQHNYSLSQPGMESLDLHLLLFCQHQCTTVMSLSSPFSGPSMVSSKQVGSHLKWWWLNTGGILKIAWFHTKLQNPSRFLYLFQRTVTVDHCPGEQFPSTWCESMHDSVCNKSQGTGGWVTTRTSYG